MPAYLLRFIFLLATSGASIFAIYASGPEFYLALALPYLAELLRPMFSWLRIIPAVLRLLTASVLLCLLPGQDLTLNLLLFLGIRILFLSLGHALSSDAKADSCPRMTSVLGTPLALVVSSLLLMRSPATLWLVTFILLMTLTFSWYPQEPPSTRHGDREQRYMVIELASSGSPADTDAGIACYSLKPRMRTLQSAFDRLSFLFFLFSNAAGIGLAQIWSFRAAPCAEASLKTGGILLGWFVLFCSLGRISRKSLGRSITSRVTYTISLFFPAFAIFGLGALSQVPAILVPLASLGFFVGLQEGTFLSLLAFVEKDNFSSARRFIEVIMTTAFLISIPVLGVSLRIIAYSGAPVVIIGLLMIVSAGLELNRCRMLEKGYESRK